MVPKGGRGLARFQDFLKLKILDCGMIFGKENFGTYFWSTSISVGTFLELLKLMFLFSRYIM